MKAHLINKMIENLMHVPLKKHGGEGKADAHIEITAMKLPKDHMEPDGDEEMPKGDMDGDEAMDIEEPKTPLEMAKADKMRKKLHAMHKMGK